MTVVAIGPLGKSCFVDRAKDVAKIVPRTQPRGNAVDWTGVKNIVVVVRIVYLACHYTPSFLLYIVGHHHNVQCIMVHEEMVCSTLNFCDACSCVCQRSICVCTLLLYTKVLHPL